MEVSRLEELLVSRSGTPFPKWMKWMGLAVGLLLVADGMRSFMFHKILVGAVVAYVSGYDKRIFLSAEGVVRQTRTWLGGHTTLLPWDEIQHVGFAFRGSRMLCFFEKDVTGLKVAFDRSDEAEVRRILELYIPEVETAVVGEK